MTENGTDLDHRCSRAYDLLFDAAPSLTWRPWVGREYPSLAGHQFLVVGESHYTREKDPLLAEAEITRNARDRTYTRKCVVEGLIEWEWVVPTFSNLHKLLVGPRREDAEKFWVRACYCNIIQRQLKVRLGSGELERPTFVDFIEGWRSLFHVIGELRPSGVLMIGTEATNHLASAIEGTDATFSGPDRRARIGRTYPRYTTLTIRGRQVPMYSIQHCGKYFSHGAWRAFLAGSCPEIAAIVSVAANE